MKTAFLSILLLTALFYACDKVKQPVPGTSAGLDWSLYPDGDSAHYAQNHWPTFAANTNTQRNAIIEDFTGHQCGPCYGTLLAVHDKVHENPSRIFAAAIHAGASENGFTELQDLLPGSGYTEIFYNPEGLSLGAFFFNISGGFVNPKISINRQVYNNDITYSAAQLDDLSDAVLNSELKVNIQAATNYFPSPKRGLFLHTEVDVIDPSVTNNLGLVVYVMEDSLIAQQNSTIGVVTEFVHHDIMRGCIDGKPFGRTLTNNYLINGKYYCNYSYQVPEDLNIDNMHLLLYVYDKVTHEIYQVIKHEL